jgi:2-hydroxychromene-2-carboxylate isomerase
MTGIAKQAPEIEFPFEFGSNYGYLSVMRFEEEARGRCRLEAVPCGANLSQVGDGKPSFSLQRESCAMCDRTWRVFAGNTILHPRAALGTGVCARGIVAPSARGTVGTALQLVKYAERAASFGGQNFPSTHRMSGC